MDLVLCGLTYESVLVYLDDIIVFSRDFESHVQRLRDVFGRLRKANLKLHPAKCCFFQRRVKFLGHVISEAGIEVQTDKVATVQDWPTPRNLTELRSFVGLCSYYRRFINKFADVAAPLHELQRKGVPFVWTAEQDRAFSQLKEALTTAPVLGMPRDEGTFFLDCDSSDFGLGSVLSQFQDGKEVVISYASRALSRAEQNYDVTKKELLAVVYGLKTFKQYLLGRRFVVRSDHAALQWLRKTPEPLGQQARWLTFIEMFDFEICHRAGSRHGNADALSRKPQHAAEDSVEVRTVLTEPSACAGNSVLSADAQPFVPRLQAQAEPSLHDSGDVCEEAFEWVDAVACAAQCEPSEEGIGLAASLAGEPMAELQLKDPVIGPILRWRMQQEEPPSIEALLPETAAVKQLWSQWHRLSLIGGVLYRTEKRIGDVQVNQLLIPTACKQDFMQRVHAGMCGGHLGNRRTLDQVQRRAYWIGWRADVQRFCRQCVRCNEYFRGQLPRSAPLQPLVTGAPLERLHVDLTGPHPRSRRGSVWIMTCTDSFTKFCEAFPLPNKEAATVARVLVEQVICRYGTPISLLTDRGKEVDGQLMAEVCKLLDIDKQHTTPYKSSSNGQAERMHRTINSIIGKMVSENQSDWDCLLPYVMAAYRSSRHESTGFTPNYLMFAREVHAPVDLVYGCSEAHTRVTYDGYGEEMKSRMQTAYTLVRENLHRAALRSKRYYDLRVRPYRYQPGDWVYYYNPRKFAGRQEKWTRKFSGAYLVVKVLGPVNVMLQRSPNSRPFCTHIDKVKPYVADELPKSWLVASDVSADVPAPARGQTEKPTKSSRLADEPIVGGDELVQQGQTCDQAEVDTPLAGVPPANYKTPRPRRNRRPPQRFAD